MRGLERKKIQSIVDTLQSGVFDENDVDNLFIKLRDNSYGNILFREIGNFIAHPTIRDTGPIHELIESLQLSFRFNSDYDYGNIPLDISIPFPSYIKEHMKYQVKKYNEKDLISKFKIGKIKLLKEIDRIFPVNGQMDQTNPQQLKPTEKLLFDAFRYLFTLLIVKPFCTQLELLDAIMIVLTGNKINFDRKKLSEQCDKIIICVLLLLHGIEFKLKNSPNGECRIYYDNDQISTQNILGLSGVVPYAQSTIKIIFQLISTNLSAIDWCSETILKDPKAFDKDLCLTPDFKIGLL
jgi:hypothetical protein